MSFLLQPLLSQDNRGVVVGTKEKMASLMRFADMTPDVKTRETPKTATGGVLSIFLGLAMAGFFVYFVYVFATGASTKLNNERTSGLVREVPMKCVSTSGCNVTFNYSTDNECRALAGLPDRFIEEDEEFNLPVCRSRVALEGTLVRSDFDRNQMYYVKGVLWIVELLQDGTYIPVGSIKGSLYSVHRLTNTRVIDSTNSRGEPILKASFWESTPTGTEPIDFVCVNRSVPFGRLCGGVQFTFSIRFFEEEKIKSGTIGPSVFAPAMGLQVAAGFILAKYAYVRKMYNERRQSGRVRKSSSSCSDVSL